MPVLHKRVPVLHPLPVLGILFEFVVECAAADPKDLAGFCLVSAILFHANFEDQVEMIMFMKNVAIAGGFLFLVAHGAGSYSLDNYRRN